MSKNISHPHSIVGSSSKHMYWSDLDTIHTELLAIALALVQITKNGYSTNFLHH